MAAGTQVVDMQKAENGVYSSTATWGDTSTVAYHRLQVTKPGLLYVAGAKYSYGNQYGMYITLCNSKMQNVDCYSSGQYVTSSDGAYYGVKKGTYYIKVTGYDTYTVAASLKNMADKGGASKKKATTIKHKKQITGVMAAGEKAKKADWFKFNMTKSKKLYLTLSTAGNGYFAFYIYGPSYKNGLYVASLKNSGGKYYSTNSLTRKASKIKAGTYYIKVVRSSSSASSSGAYTIKWQMK